TFAFAALFAFGVGVGAFFALALGGTVGCVRAILRGLGVVGTRLLLCIGLSGTVTTGAVLPGGLVDRAVLCGTRLVGGRLCVLLRCLLCGIGLRHGIGCLCRGLVSGLLGG